MAISVDVVILSNVVIMGMIAVNDMRRHKLVEESRDHLNTDEPANKAGHKYEPGWLVGETTLLKVALGLGQHAI